MQKKLSRILIISALLVTVIVLFIFKKQASNHKKASGNILAIVAGEQITQKQLENEYEDLSKQYKDMFKNDKELLLEQLVIREILVQKAIQEGHIPSENSTESQEESGIQKLIQENTTDVDISETEIKEFYQQNKDKMQAAAYEQVKNEVRNYLAQQKQQEQSQKYIEQLRKEADVVLNEEWLAEQEAAKPENPLTDALQNGLPTVLDLGSDTCVPCQMMMPIFDELEKELQGKANILLLKIADYRNLANKYKVRVIPTQIFFDKDGKQYWRHEGFLSKEDILKKLEETGLKL
jgi:thioredoxin 1